MIEFRFRYLKYRFVDDAMNEELYNFNRVRTECLSLNSTVWEILDGRDEWDSVMEMAKDMRRGQLWINAQIDPHRARDTCHRPSPNNTM